MSVLTISCLPSLFLVVGFVLFIFILRLCLSSGVCCCDCCVCCCWGPLEVGVPLPPVAPLAAEADEALAWWWWW